MSCVHRLVAVWDRRLHASGHAVGCGVAKAQLRPDPGTASDCEPPTRIGRIVEPRRALLRQALAEADLQDADLDALTSMLVGSFYCRYVTIAGIPDHWPNRVLSAIWPPDTSPASPRHDHSEEPEPEPPKNGDLTPAPGGAGSGAERRHPHNVLVAA
jgi:hypothetical protein